MLNSILPQPSEPIYNRVSTWLLLVPMLFFFANGNFSFTTRTTDAIAAQNAHLVNTSQGFRPEVILYFVFMVILVFVGYRVAWRGIVRNPLVIAPILWCGLSSLWSASPILSARGTVELAMSTFFAIYLYEAFETERLMRMWILVGTVAALTSLVLIALLPSYGITQISGLGEWRGIASHKNTMGVNMTYLIVPVLFARIRPWFRVLYSCVLIFLAVMSKSREAWFVCLATLVFVAWLSLFRRLRDKERVLVILVSVVLLVAVLSVVMMNFDSLMYGIGKNPSMTGRTEIYEATLDSLKKKPLLGYGFLAFWSPQNPEAMVVALTVHWMAIGYAENGMLETALGVGCIGVFLAFLMVARGGYQSIRLIRSGLYNPRVGWFLTLIFLELITNIEAGAVLTPANLPWMMTIIACVGLADEARSVRAARRLYRMEEASLLPIPAQS
jgi:exopolysaccharide production protein ExoQ